MATHILVPIDDSKPAMKAFDYALDTFPDSKITVLHVIDPTDIFHFADADLEPSDVQNFDEYTKQREEAVDRLFDEPQEKAADRGVELETVKEIGQPARRIIEYAEENDIDHIIIGSHGRSGMSRILLGSIAESVARRAPTPITIIR